MLALGARTSAKKKIKIKKNLAKDGFRRKNKIPVWRRKKINKMWPVGIYCS